LHHLCGRLEVEVETQVLTRVGFGNLERFRELGLDGGGDFVDRVQEALDLERGLRIGRTIMYLDEKLSQRRRRKDEWQLTKWGLASRRASKNSVASSVGSASLSK
jgi:hypothetical protein